MLAKAHMIRCNFMLSQHTCLKKTVWTQYTTFVSSSITLSLAILEINLPVPATVEVICIKRLMYNIRWITLECMIIISVGRCSRNLLGMNNLLDLKYLVVFNNNYYPMVNVAY